MDPAEMTASRDDAWGRAISESVYAYTLADKDRQMQMQTELPHEIDWGRLEFRFRKLGYGLSAWWGEVCIATVTANRTQDLVPRLRKQVEEQHWRAMLRPAGAEASRTVDDMFSEVVEVWPELSPLVT